jgi:4-amino-4-deoxychorismate lyase
LLINGKPGDAIAVLDRGLQYGDGLFETVAVVDGRPCLWQRHLARLQQGCDRLGIARPDGEQLLAEALQVIGHSPRSVLKIIITRGTGGRGYRPPLDVAPTRILCLAPWPDHPAAAQNQGVVVRICDTRLGDNPRLAGIKHLNRLEQVLAQAEWRDPAVAEGLMLDSAGCVIEGTMSNLFVLNEGRLLTSDLSRCGIAGVMRGLVLEMAASLGLPCAVEEMTLDDLGEADALFLTNSLIGIWPVRALEGREYELQAIPPALVEAVMAQGFRP